MGIGTDGKMYWTSYDMYDPYSPGGWTTPLPIPNGLFKSGVAATVLNGVVYAAALGLDNNYYWSWSAGSAFQPWSAIPPNMYMYSQPALSSWAGGHLDIAGLDGAAHVAHATSDNYGQTWTYYSDVGLDPYIYSPASFSPAVGVIRMAATNSGRPPLGTIYEGDGP
jgi:hypothetical protein